MVFRFQQQVAHILIVSLIQESECVREGDKDREKVTVGPKLDQNMSEEVNEVSTEPPLKKSKTSSSNSPSQQKQEPKNSHNTDFLIHENGISDLIINKYDGFIIDQFGVLHNGYEGLDGASECVNTLVDIYNKKCVILSNSSSLAVATKNKLPTMGFDKNKFITCVTSGEEASHYISNNFLATTKTETEEENGGDGKASAAADDDNANGSTTNGSKKTETMTTTKKKALFITWKSSKNPMTFIDKCNSSSSKIGGGNASLLEITDKVDEADFVILHGVDVLRGPDGKKSSSNNNNNGSSDDDNDDDDEEEVIINELELGNFHETEDYSIIDPILEQCSKRNLLMICANPDYIMIKPDGTIGHMPGKILQRYQTKYNGKVISFGKPNVEHFEACLRILNLPRHKVVHVGDSLHHDIQGANDTGIDSIFVVGGIHREELNNVDLGKVPTKDTLDQLFTKYQQIPTHVVPMFRL